MSRLGLVSFALILLSLVSVSSRSGFVVFKYNKARTELNQMVAIYNILKVPRDHA